jgi:pantetheine-phosphate adenylyltransferase
MSIAVYAGTFDPITSGHLSVVRQAARLFSHLRVLVAVNPEKSTLFSPEDRLEMIRQVVGVIPNVSADRTLGLVVEYCREIGAAFLVRGIRGETDAGFETQLAQANRVIAPEICTILLPAEQHLSSVSSSGVKQMFGKGEDISPYCPAIVTRWLENRLKRGEVR